MRRVLLPFTLSEEDLQLYVLEDVTADLVQLILPMPLILQDVQHGSETARHCHIICHSLLHSLVYFQGIPAALNTHLPGRE